MALTDVFLSPSGAGDEDGSSVANALPVIEDGGGGDDWAPDFLALDRANKRFVFLTGTYNVQTKATFSGSAPSATQPNQWVGVDSSGNVLRPKFDETGLRLDTTNYPKFVCSADVAMVDTEENTYYKCLSFENTNTSYARNSVVEPNTADQDQQLWVGCEFKAKARDTNAKVISANNCGFSHCVFEFSDAGRSTFDQVVKATNNVHLTHCRIIGPSGPGEVLLASGGDQVGLELTALTGKIRNCVITRCNGHGVHLDSTSNKSDIDIAHCTICHIGGDGVNTDNNTSALPGKGSLEGCIIFGCSDKGIETNADDSKQAGAQILAMGGNTGGNFNNMDSYEDMIDVIAITTADFIDYANKDYRIHRDSTLYRFYGTENFGAIQNDDFEFVSVS